MCGLQCHNDSLRKNCSAFYTGPFLLTGCLEDLNNGRLMLSNCVRSKCVMPAAATEISLK